MYKLISTILTIAFVCSIMFITGCGVDEPETTHTDNPSRDLILPPIVDNDDLINFQSDTEYDITWANVYVQLTVVATDGTQIYSKPDFDSDIIGVKHYGETMWVTGISDDTQFYRIDYKRTEMSSDSSGEIDVEIPGISSGLWVEYSGPAFINSLDVVLVIDIPEEGDGTSSSDVGIAIGDSIEFGTLDSIQRWQVIYVEDGHALMANDASNINELKWILNYWYDQLFTDEEKQFIVEKDGQFMSWLSPEQEIQYNMPAELKIDGHLPWVIWMNVIDNPFISSPTSADGYQLSIGDTVYARYSMLMGSVLTVVVGEVVIIDGFNATIHWNHVVTDNNVVRPIMSDVLHIRRWYVTDDGTEIALGVLHDIYGIRNLFTSFENAKNHNISASSMINF